MHGDLENEFTKKSQNSFNKDTIITKNIRIRIRTRIHIRIRITKFIKKYTILNGQKQEKNPMSVYDGSTYFILLYSPKANTLGNISAFAQNISGNRRQSEVENGGRRPKQNINKFTMFL